MNTTLNQIRDESPCADGWKKLLAHLGKTKADDEAISILTILDSNGLDDALWCLRAVTGHDREIRLYAVWCARQVQHLMTDKRSLDALDVAERYANGLATADDLAAAIADAWSAASAAWSAADASRSAAEDAADAEDAAWSAAWSAAGGAWSAAWSAAGGADAARAAARAAAGGADAARAAADAADAAWSVADAARSAQEKRLREACAKLCEEDMKIRLAETIIARAK